MEYAVEKEQKDTSCPRLKLQLQSKRKPRGNNETVLVSLMSDNFETLMA